MRLAITTEFGDSKMEFTTFDRSMEGSDLNCKSRRVTDKENHLDD